MNKIITHQAIKGILIASISGFVIGGIMILLNEYVLQDSVQIVEWWRGYVVGVVTALILKRFLKD